MASNYNAQWTGGLGGFGGKSLYDYFYADNPGAGYQRWQNQSFGRNNWQSNFGQFLNQNQGLFYNRYEADLAEKPLGYSFMDWLGENTGGIQEQFRRGTPRQRGENPEAYSGRVRWVGV